MPRQHEIELLRDVFRKQRIVQQQNILHARPRRQIGRLDVPAGRPGDLDFPIRGRRGRVRQPCPARARERFSEAVKIRAAPVIVIARHAVERRLDPLQDFQRLRRELLLLDQVPGEANRVRGEAVDPARDPFQVRPVSLMMNVRNMDDPMARLLFAQLDGPHLDPLRFDPFCVGANQPRGGQGGERQKPPPAELAETNLHKHWTIFRGKR